MRENIFLPRRGSKKCPSLARTASYRLPIQEGIIYAVQRLEVKLQLDNGRIKPLPPASRFPTTALVPEMTCSLQVCRE
jgi:hypothetical protein